MTMPSEKHIIPKELPRDSRWSKNSFSRSLALMFETLSFKMYHTALRFEDDGILHIPTYGLRLTSDEFNRAAHVIYCEELPLDKGLKVCMRSHIKSASIGLNAFAKSLEDDWDLVQIKCNAHCKLCTSRCSQVMSIWEILDLYCKENNIGTIEQIRSDFDGAAQAMDNYTKQVTSNHSFADTSKHWYSLSDYILKISDHIYNIL